MPILFDARAYDKRLKDAGLNDAQAEPSVDPWSGLDISQLATKTDIQALEQRTDTGSAKQMAEVKRSSCPDCSGARIRKAHPP